MSVLSDEARLLPAGPFRWMTGDAQNGGSQRDVESSGYWRPGMDRAKDMARIDRPAQSAGVAPDTVEVSPAPHIMTRTVPEAMLTAIEPAVPRASQGFDRTNTLEPTI